MVVSKIDESIVYPDIRSIDTSDVGYDANLYEMELLPSINGIIALGNVKYKFSEKNVLFIPVYLINKDEITIQIGVYEFASALYPNLLDEDNDFDISKLESQEPLYYSFVNKKILLQNGAKEGVLEEEGEEGEEGSTDTPVSNKKMGIGETKKDKLLDSLTSETQKIISDIFEEDSDVLNAIDGTMNLDMEERKKFKKTKKNTWIQNFMKNMQYGIIDNEGGGDCLFAVIRDALKSLDKSISIKNIRQIISEKATSKEYNDFKEQYDMYNKGIINATHEMKKIADEVEILRNRKIQAKGRDEQKAMVDLATKKIDDFKRSKREKAYAIELLSDYKWMEGIDNLEKFKAVLKTCNFWAEAWSINLLETLLNIKIIILSSQNYGKHDLGNVLLCDRGFVDPDLESKKKIFSPKYYIIADYTGTHYKLITSGENHIFTFNTIPYSLKMLIVEKCMEKNAGIFKFIPNFQAFKTQILGEKIEEKNDDLKTSNSSNSSDMYNPSTIFQFYSKSSDKPLPGKGSGETIDKKNIQNFSNLAAIKGWRKVLSNFHIAPFELDGHKWNSVEHYYQGSKFKKSHHEFYLQFSDDSNTDLSKDPVLAKAHGGKTGKFKGKQVRPKEIIMDTDFFGGEKRGVKEMEAAQMAKYTQNDEARRVLLETKDAKLQHYSRGSPAIVFEDSMRIRKQLSLNKK
jgi:predicted NAD-dependent protein-ADP-ribosyltransferase YbiA (DUF1768 family)